MVKFQHKIIETNEERIERENKERMNEEENVEEGGIKKAK